ncbi:asparagine synthetase B family protein [Halochromatium glycolicum]|uniref:asparagine synthase (glutamine-hydrolyzing) n=1 Tax=Halochromatium glycolicum TaxID=85075 RepID=A0AAJ0U7E7_9GAMM|nr:asparagine synthase-related protein [Halochromatium glycolicum]MBK1706661.1 asparagine synthase [Halochromatium glycolicum]
MTGLCGWFSLEQGQPPTDLEARAQQLPAAAGASVASRANAHGACAVRAGWISQDASGCIAALAGHPRWRDAELAGQAKDHDPAFALLSAYQRLGDGLFERLAGDFALVILDPSAPRLLAGIDRTGQLPLHCAPIPGGLVFGSSANSVLAHPGLERRLTADGLFHYLFFHMLPAPVSLYAGLHKLQAAHRLDHDRGGWRMRPYWLPAFTEPAEADQAALGDEMKALLRAAVARAADIGHADTGLGVGQSEVARAADTAPSHVAPGTAPDKASESAIGAFLSGGLDSSTVAGLLAELRPGGADSFSIGFEAEGYDELPYARLAAQQFGLRAHEYYVTPEDVVEAVPLIAASYDEPFGNSSALPAYFCARNAAETGVTRLLGGDGGDELFAGNARYAKQGVFEHWHRIAGPLRHRLLEPLFTRLPQRVPLLRKARSYVEQARIPLPDRLQTYNYLHRIALAELFTPGFLEQVDTEAPWQLMRTLYQRPQQATSLNRMLYLDWQQTLADNDLRKVTRMCQLAGVDVVYPMLDDELVAFSCRVPSELKLHRGRLRHFYKEAMRDFLPAGIIDKKKHGFGLPFGVWMHDHKPLQELAYDNLLKFKGRGIVRAAFIDQLIRWHREAHAVYYGELVWVLMMLELWLSAQGENPVATESESIRR